MPAPPVMKRTRPRADTTITSLGPDLLRKAEKVTIIPTMRAAPPTTASSASPHHPASFMPLRLLDPIGLCPHDERGADHPNHRHRRAPRHRLALAPARGGGVALSRHHGRHLAQAALGNRGDDLALC